MVVNSLTRCLTVFFVFTKNDGKTGSVSEVLFLPISETLLSNKTATNRHLVCFQVAYLACLQL